MVLNDSPDRGLFWKICRKAGPGLPFVGAFEKVGLQVAVLVVVERYIYGIGVVKVYLYVVDISRGGYTRNAAHFHFGPVGAHIVGALHEAVVGADIDHVLIVRRLGNGCNGVES